MEYSKIVAVTGLPGLFELISSKNDGAIVRSLDDKSTKFVSSRIHQFSHLESIEVYSTRQNVNLVEVLKAMEESKESLPDEKDNSALKKYFEKVYKDLDFERVYSSDLKKMVKWYSILKKNEVEIKLTETAEEPETEEMPAEPVVEKAAPEKPKAAPKKSAAKKVEEPAEKPKAKAKEKAVEKKKEKPAEKTAAKEKAKKSAPKKKSGK